MGQLFLSILDLSVKASILIIAVVFLRLIFKKAPRHIICLLWLLVGLRLVVPFSIESTLSLIPSAAPVSARVELKSPDTELILPDVPVQEMPVTTPAQPAITVPDTPVYIPEQDTTAPSLPQLYEPRPQPMNAEQIAAIVWLCGLAGFLIYLLLSYLLLRRKVAESIPLGDGVWKCPVLASPFVLGLFRPRIYISGAMDEVQTAYVLSHERAHIARRDHWTKPIGFVILAIHWFNPLVWLAYILLCRDIELACDERVVKDMDLPARKGYSQALLACSVRSNPLAACPLAFGEVGVKQRIKSVLSYKKPAFWVIIAAVLCMIAAAVLFMTDPREDTQSPEEYTAALLEQHRDRLYLSDIEIDRDSLFESYSEDTSYEIFYPNGENFCSTTNTDNVYYWHDQSGKATPELAATALIGVMLQSVNHLPESQRSFTVLDYHVAEQSLTSWDDMPSRLLDGYPIDVEGLDNAEALEEIDRVFAEHLAKEQDLFGFDAFVMDLDADMWVFDPEFTFEFEGLCNMYRREEMEKYGLIAENGLCLEAQQGSDSYFVHILIKNGDVWRMQRLNGLIEYISADGEVITPPAAPSTEPAPEEPDTLYTSGDEASVDLDGDGVEESILVDSRNHIRVNGKDVDLGYSDSFVIMDLDPADNWREIVVERLSIDGETLHFYRFDTLSWSALYLGEIPGTVEGLSVEDGYISSLCSFRELPILKVSVPWKLDIDGFVMMEGTNDPGYYYIGNQDWYTLDRDVIAYAGLRYDEKSSDETIIEQGTEIWPLGYHLNGWLKLMDGNEEKYWINLYRPTPLPEPDIYDPQMYYPLEVPMGTSVAADLDGDGNDEIIYQHFKSNGQAVLTINGFDYSETVRTMCGYQFNLNRESYYITDLERTDGRLEITLFDEGPSGDPVVYFFQYYDNELHFVGEIPWWRDQLRFDGDSYVLGAFRLSILQTWFASAAWRYADGQLQLIRQDFYHALARETVLDWTTGKEIEHHYALCDMYVYASKNLSSQPLVLRAGTQFDLLGTDNVAWILLQTLDGEQYWLHAGLDNPDGITNSMEIIAGLDMSD